MSMSENVNLTKSKKFAYFMGYFAADGCLYKSRSVERFEFSDGTQVQEEIHYSLKFINKIKKLVKKFADVSALSLRRRGNRFVLSFRSEELSSILKNYFGIFPGKKTFTINLPKIYKKTELEKFFWVGVMDGDGMIARNSRKISLELGSKEMITSFVSFLRSKSIFFKTYSRKLGDNQFYRVDITSNFIRDYARIIGFNHPRKKRWLNRHLQKKDFYINHKINKQKHFSENRIIDYEKILSSERIYVVDGKSLLQEYGIKSKATNVKFKDVLSYLQKIHREELFKKLSQYRWKMSKGSTNSVRMPLRYNKEILKITKYTRIRQGSITISRRYTKVFNEEPGTIIKKIENMFDISPTYTYKGEPLFCSGVLCLFFQKLLKGTM